MKRQYLKMKSCRGPVAACPWHAAVLFKHFHYHMFLALLVWSRCGFLSPLLCPKHVSSDKLSRIINYQWRMGWHRRMVEPRTTLVEVRLISKDNFFEIFWGSWWWGAHTGFWDEFEVIMPFFEVFWGEWLWLALRPHSEANWEFKAGLLVCWLVGFWAVLFDLVQLFLKRVQVCLLHWQSSIKRFAAKFSKWFYHLLKRQY